MFAVSNFKFRKMRLNNLWKGSFWEAFVHVDTRFTLMDSANAGTWLTKSREIVTPIGEATYVEYAPSDGGRTADDAGGKGVWNSGGAGGGGGAGSREIMSPTALTGAWTKISIVVPAMSWVAGSQFNLRVGGMAGTGAEHNVGGGGSVWIDDVAIRKV